MQVKPVGALVPWLTNGKVYEANKADDIEAGPNSCLYRVTDDDGEDIIIRASATHRAQCGHAMPGYWEVVTE